MAYASNTPKTWRVPVHLVQSAHLVPVQPLQPVRYTPYHSPVFIRIEFFVSLWATTSFLGGRCTMGKFRVLAIAGIRSDELGCANRLQSNDVELDSGW